MLALTLTFIVAPDVTPCAGSKRMQAREPSQLWNPWGGSHDVQNRGNQGKPTKKFKKSFLHKTPVLLFQWIVSHRMYSYIRAYLDRKIDKLLIFWYCDSVFHCHYNHFACHTTRESLPQVYSCGRCTCDCYTGCEYAGWTLFTCHVGGITPHVTQPPPLVD